MPSQAQWEGMLDVLLYMVLPAFGVAVIVMGVIERVGGIKQTASGAALALIVGALFGLAMRDAGSLFLKETLEKHTLEKESLQKSLAIVPHILTFGSGPNWDRLPWALLGALCIGRLASLTDGGWLLRSGAALGIAWWVLPEDSRDKLVWLAPAFAAVIWLQWVILDRLAAQPGSSSLALCLTLALLTASCVLIHAGTKRLMDPAVVLAFALAGVWLIAIWRGVEVGGAIPAIAVALPGLLLMGQLNTEKVHWSAYALTAAAPFMLVFSMPLARGPKWRLHGMRLALVLLPLVIAIIIAAEAGPLDFGDNLGE